MILFAAFGVAHDRMPTQVEQKKWSTRWQKETTKSCKEKIARQHVDIGNNIFQALEQHDAKRASQFGSQLFKSSETKTSNSTLI